MNLSANEPATQQSVYELRSAHWFWRLFLLAAFTLVASFALLASYAIIFYPAPDGVRPYLPFFLSAGAIVAIVSAITYAAWFKTRVLVGEEGVFVHGAWGKKSYIPFSKLPRVHDFGEAINLHCNRIGAFDPLSALKREREHLCEVIENAHARYGKRPRARVVQALARGDTSHDAWRDALSSSDRTNYRKGSADHAMLQRVVADPTASPEQRIGAALALSGTETNDEYAAETRTVAEGCAHPKLRIALENASEGQLPADLHETLEQLEADWHAPI